MFLLCHAGMGLRSCRGESSGALQRGKKQQRWQEHFKCAFFGKVFMMLTKRVTTNYTENTPGTRSWAKWHKTKSCVQSSGHKLSISEEVIPGNQGGKLFNPDLECLPAMSRLQWLFRKKFIFTFQGFNCSPVSALKVCSAGTCKCVLGEKTWLKSKAFISDVFGLGIGRHILRAF